MNALNWVIPEKIHTSLTDSVWEILMGGGLGTLEIWVRWEGGQPQNCNSQGLFSNILSQFLVLIIYV